MMSPRFLVSVGICTAALISHAVVHAANYTISSPWRYAQKVTITGVNLAGARPSTNKLCVAPAAARDKKACLYDFQLDEGTWDDQEITFYPPQDAPVSGLVILQIEEPIQKCFGSAGCLDTTEPIEKEIGSFVIEPYINKITVTTSGAAARSIEPMISYKVDGRFFGNDRGKIFLQQPRGSREVPYNKILSWSDTSILFSAPPDIASAAGLSVNNNAAAVSYDLPTTLARSSSSKSYSNDLNQRTKTAEQEIDNLKKDFAERWGGDYGGETYVGSENQAVAKKVLRILQDSQATVDKYAAQVQTVGNSCLSLTEVQNTRECQTICAQRTEDIARSACENIGSLDLNACVETGKQYKSLQDSEKECYSSCKQLCATGRECVCQEGRVNKSAYRILDTSRRSLASAYKMLHEDTAADKYMVKALKQELEDNGLILIKNKESVTLAKAGNTGKAAFADVSADHPYSSAIDWAKQSGILQGYPDGTFKPDNVVNRAEFLKVVLGAKGIGVSDASGASGFKDVDENGWYAPYIRHAKAQGIVQGYPDGTFKPNQAVNFAEALKMAYSALGVSTTDVGGDWYQRYLQHAKHNNVLFNADPQVDVGMGRKDVVWIVWKVMTHTGNWQQPANLSAPQPSPTSSAEFGDGSFEVGKDIQPGTYRTRTTSPECYYSRLGGFSGELDDIIANENTNSFAIVTISDGDLGFVSKGCGAWTRDLSAVTTSRTSFGEGTLLVGTDMEAGTYKSTGGEGCYYARLAGFSGELDDIIANENTNASALVTIASSDKGFTSKRCGTWTKVR